MGGATCNRTHYASLMVFKAVRFCQDSIIARENANAILPRAAFGTHPRGCPFPNIFYPANCS
jgi:hypothetical protein